ncbi:MAG: cobalamin B12-binding domain-containing protein [Rhodovarius sp.]|nr:cobalamin B12-binding domain-containing protein [Rhodovarius sp.]
MPDLSPGPSQALPFPFGSAGTAPRAPAPACAAAGHRQTLVEALQHQVIPALRERHPPPPRPRAESEALVEELLAGGSGEALIDRFLRAGWSFEALALCLLAPAAVRLGEMWQEDRCSSAAVTLGLWRLRRLLARAAELLPAPICAPNPARSILLAPLPGEQHDFGLAMVAEFLLRAGWIVLHSRPCHQKALVDDIRALRPAVVGLALASVEAEGEVALLLRLIRQSLPDAPPVMLGGPAIARDPDLARRCGADAAACCARSALRAAEGLLPLASRNPLPVRMERCVRSTGTGGGVPEPRSGRHGAPRLGRC